MRERCPDVALSISVTTRIPRPGEAERGAYRFIDAPAFDRLEADGAFLESALVHGNRYGTPRAPVEQALAAGKTVILEIDVQGARAVRAAMPDAVLIFVEPPSAEDLKDRLEGRRTDSPDVIARRLANAPGELAAAAGFDHRVVNDDLEDAVSQVIRILEGTRSPTPQPRVAPSEGETS